jgi:HEAT repeat protein
VIPASVLLLALVGLAALAGLLLVAIGSCRLARGWHLRRQAAVVAVLRPAVAAVVAEAMDDPGAGAAAAPPRRPGPRHSRSRRPRWRRRAAGRAAGPAAGTVPGRLAALADGLPRRQRGVLDGIVLGYLGKVRGPARQPLLDLLEHNGTVARARRRLHRPGAVGRARAAEVLGRAGGPAVALDLLRLLSDREPAVRAVAAAGLSAATPSAEVVRALLAAVEGDRRVPTGLLVDALLRLGPDAAGHLAAALADGAPHVQAVAAEALGRLASMPATQALLAVLAEPGADAEVRSRAAGALGRIGAPAAVDPLIGLLRPGQPPALRVAAAGALGDLGSPRAVPGLLPLLAEAYPLAAAAAAALAQLGSAGAAALAEVADREPGTPAGQHAAAGLAVVELATPAPIRV